MRRYRGFVWAGLACTALSGCAYFGHASAPPPTQWTTGVGAAPPGWNTPEAPGPTVMLGERIRFSRLALRTNDTGTYNLYVGGRFYARYHPWEHTLAIRSDERDAPAGECRYAPGGELSITGAEPGEAGLDAQACSRLLGELDAYFKGASL